MEVHDLRARTGAIAPARVPIAPQNVGDDPLLFGAGDPEKGVLAALASAVPFLRPSTQLEILQLLLSRERKPRPYV